MAPESRLSRQKVVVDAAAGISAVLSSVLSAVHPIALALSAVVLPPALPALPVRLAVRAALLLMSCGFFCRATKYRVTRHRVGPD